MLPVSSRSSMHRARAGLSEGQLPLRSEIGQLTGPAARTDRVAGARGGGAPKHATDPLAGLNQLRQIDTRFDLQAFKQVQHVLGCDIPGGTLREWAAAESGHARIESCDPHLQAGVDV